MRQIRSVNDLVYRKDINIYYISLLECVIWTDLLELYIHIMNLFYGFILYMDLYYKYIISKGPNYKEPKTIH